MITFCKQKTFQYVFILHQSINFRFFFSPISRVPPLIAATMMDPDMVGQDMGVGKLGTQAEKDRRLKKK